MRCHVRDVYIWCMVLCAPVEKMGLIIRVGWLWTMDTCSQGAPSTITMGALGHDFDPLFVARKELEADQAATPFPLKVRRYLSLAPQHGSGAHGSGGRGRRGPGGHDGPAAVERWFEDWRVHELSMAHLARHPDDRPQILW